MEQRIPLGQWPTADAASGWSRSVSLGLAAGFAVLLAVYLGLGVAFVRALPSPAFDLDVPAVEGPLAVDTSLVPQTTGWGTSVDDITLIEFQLDEAGEVVGQREVPVRYQVITEGRLPGDSRGTIERTDGGSLLVHDAWYELTVRGAGRTLSWLGLRSVPLSAFAAFGTPLTPRPQVAEGLVLSYGEPLAIGWNVPISGFDYVVRPEVRTRSWLSEDGDTAYIALEEFQQGTRYEVEVTEARALSGAPLQQATSATFSTPPALRVVGFSPENGARDVDAGLDPILTFNAPVANPELAEAMIVVSPETAGRFRWLAPNRVQFVTDKGFPYSSNISLSVRPGTEGLRSVDGGYVEDEATLAYRTRIHKRIDVNLSRQVVTLFEDGQAVFSTTASTGVPGAETPVGNFRVQYKMEKTRMRGTNPSGRSYDIPDVPWVLVIFDDYAFHGAPWRQAWGTPLSNGCVSMPTPAAKHVYDWAPVGTPITIHY